VAQPTADDLAPLLLTHDTTVPKDWLDQMGHMNVMWYTHLFSYGTVGVLRAIGLNREYFETHRKGSFALEAHVRYFSEIHAGTRVSVRSRLVGRSKKRMHYVHFIVNEDTQVLSTTCEFVSAFMDMNERKMAELPEDIAAAYDRIADEHNRLPWPAPLCGAMKP
jgi:acyl-CoA thioester hydrolase